MNLDWLEELTPWFTGRMAARLKDEKRTNPTNLSGTAIDGGSSRKVSKGDFFVVPQNTPHGFTDVGNALVLMSVHVPAGGAAK